MSKVLSLQLRPTRVSALVGQATLARALIKQFTERPPNAILFDGPSGSGKTTLARIVAVSEQCTHQKQWGTPCADCWAKWNAWAVHEVNASEKDSAGVSAAQEFAELSRFRPQPPSKRRVFIIDEAHRLSTAAQNSLLKPFEDAPDSTLWIVCTTEPQKILPTLRRRCVEYTLRGLNSEKKTILLRRALKATGIKKDVRPLVEQADLAGVNSPAFLLMALERYASGISAAESVLGGELGELNTLALCKAVTGGDVGTVQKLLKDFQPGQARLVRASVTGWLRSDLTRNTPREASLRGVELMTEMAPLEDGLLHAWLVARLLRVTLGYKRR